MREKAKSERERGREGKKARGREGSNDRSLSGAHISSEMWPRGRNTGLIVLHFLGVTVARVAQ